MSVVVVYVHGLWLSGVEGVVLRRRLGRALDAETQSFGYSSVRGTITDHALSLRRCLTRMQTDTLHVVAHSLGGLVVLRLFDLIDAGAAARQFDTRPGVTKPTGGRAEFAPGRIVLLGAPVQGCRTAARLARLPFGRTLMGRASEALLAAREPRWKGARDLGVIAGELPIGAGRLLGAFAAPNDGTVLVEETALPGAADRLIVRVSHSGLPFAASVALQTAAFLRSGRFNR